VLALGAATIAVTQEEPAPAGDDRPRKIGLEERAGTRLAQIDITVIGPPDVVTNLTTDDFRIKVHLRKVREFRLDRLCEPSGPTRARAASSAPGATDGSPVVTGPAASYLFYFDQPHLTMAGRVRSLEVASDLIDELITENSRGMIVSNARETIIVQPLTSDRSLLKQALRELEGNRGQWDMYAQLEDERVGDVVRTLNWENDLYGAVAKARLYQKEEYWRTERNLRRLAVTLGQLVDLEPPKALLYFADSTRSNAGAHYLSFFGLAVREEEPALSAMTSDALAGSLAFDEVINQAAAQGIRIYAVEARGLVAAVDIDQPNPTAMSRTRAVPSSSRVRLSDAHSTFESLAAETGGNAFLHGVRAAKIAERIVADSSCVYLASFDPAGYPEDAPLRVIVQVNRDDVELRVRGRIVLQSESARKTSELLRAFSSPDSIPDPFVVKTGVVPTGFGNGNYSALLQISVPGSPLQGATWDLGASLYSDHKVRNKASGRLSASGPGLPVIFEHEIKFKPGAYQLVAVAHESRSGLVASSEIEFDWPQLKGGQTTVGPIALLQPASGAFLREGRTRGTGSLFVATEDPLWNSRPAAFVGLVCRGKREEALRAERRLVGDTVHEFPDLHLDAEGQECAQVRDVVPSNTLRPGFYRYEIRVSNDDGILGEGRREFVALAPPVSP
jgi:VWFA-related protein